MLHSRHEAAQLLSQLWRCSAAACDWLRPEASTGLREAWSSPEGSQRTLMHGSRSLLSRMGKLNLDMAALDAAEAAQARRTSTAAGLLARRLNEGRSKWGRSAEVREGDEERRLSRKAASAARWWTAPPCSYPMRGAQRTLLVWGQTAAGEQAGAVW